jgi:hypothetical protein
MNVYEVHLSSEKADSETWITQGSAPLVAVRIDLRGTKHRTAKRLRTYSVLIAKNMTYKQWKEKFRNEQLSMASRQELEANGGDVGA